MYGGRKPKDIGGVSAASVSYTTLHFQLVFPGFDLEFGFELRRQHLVPGFVLNSPVRFRARVRLLISRQYLLKKNRP